jgi:hypothetical protein
MKLRVDIFHNIISADILKLKLILQQLVVAAAGCMLVLNTPYRKVTSVMVLQAAAGQGITPTAPTVARAMEVSVPVPVLEHVAIMEVNLVLVVEVVL